MKFIWTILFYLILSVPVLGQAQIVVENENKDTTTIIADEAFKSLSLRDQAKALKIAAKHQENTDNKKKQLSKKYTRKSVFELKRQKTQNQENLKPLGMVAVAPGDGIANVFKDLISDNSENIYWVSFLPNTRDHITLDYVRKAIYKEASRLLSNNKYGKVFTSATMTTVDGDYNYFVNNLGLNIINGVPIIKEYPGESPFDYDNNALLYLSDDCISPKSPDRELYLETLATKVDELINITEGRSLVLFTSKEDMKRVYNKVTMNNHDFNIMLQTDDVSADTLKARFKEDEHSVLFATGSFFEGIDVKGDALENVIITKLPFPVVNPIIEEKASHFSNGFNEVYLPEMIIKLKQGVGRLIRSSTDKGIVSILDPRYKDYDGVILDSLPFDNVTTNIEDVKSFATNKLGIVKIKK